MSNQDTEGDLMAMFHELTESFPTRHVRAALVGDRTKVEISMPAPLPTYVVQVLPGTWTAAQIAEGARRFEAEAKHGLAMAGVP